MKEICKGLLRRGSVFLGLVCFAATSFAQSPGKVQGTVTLASTGQPLHKAKLLLPQLGRSVETDEAGQYVFENVLPGTYTVVVQMTALAEERRTVEVEDGQAVTVDFGLRLSTLRQQITVTAGGREQTSFETFQAVSTVDSIQLVERSKSSLGDALEGESGVAKRSFGPGSGRPVLRGFDGDRVLILKDGTRTGTLSSQSADHGESLDLVGLDRLEVVKGPATLLYGSNAVGGVVNVITPQEHLFEHATQGLSGYATGFGGAANAYGGGGAGFEYVHKKWALWGSASAQRTGDYHTPIGQIFNSSTRTANAAGGLGWFGNKGFWSLGYNYENGRFGVPFAALIEAEELTEAITEPGVQTQVIGQSDERIVLPTRRHNARFTGGFRNLPGWIESFRVSLDLSNYRHSEEEIDDLTGTSTVGTTFDNKQFDYRGTFQQRKVGRLGGQFGFWGLHRNYDTVGAEALSPPVNQNNFAVFTLQELDFDRVRFQFGGRVERTAYEVQGVTIGLPNRSLTGFSGAAGMHIATWKGGAFVVNYTHSYRAPALEELYNNGPHIGSLTFEIGSPDLVSEKTNGADFSIRHQSDRIRGEVNFFYYGISDFVFLAPTGNINDGLIEAEFLQGDSRFLGTEASLSLGLHRNVWLNFGLDYVNAELESSVTAVSTGQVTPAGTPIPRIPPVRGRVGFEWRWNGLSVRPEAVMASDQERIFVTETRTPGYTLFNIAASYTLPQQHYVHVFSLNAFNLGDRLYRNHLSFIKDLSPEIGRGVRFGYTVRFF